MDNSGQYGQSINNFQSQQYPGGYIPGRMTQANNAKKKEKKDRSGLIKTICLIFTSLLAITFLGLFLFMFVQFDTVSTDVEGQIDAAVAKAKNELQTRLETEFAEREKSPFKTFAGPSDFGLLSFEYPKTWNLYISNDASKAEDYHAYFNPGQVNVVNNKTIMALRVSIINRLTEDVKKEYASKVKSGKLSLSVTQVNKNNVDVYTGEIDSNRNGIICIFKIRDKTAIIQTDAMIFTEDFYNLLSTVRFNA